MYYLFKYVCDENKQIEENNQYEIKVMHPTLLKLALPNENAGFKQLIMRAYFYLITLGKFYIYYAVSENNEIVHTSFVLGRCFKFKFLQKGEYEIGPCITKKEYRGRGIYPAVLKRIINEKNKYIKTLYIFCHKGNISSIRGILKAGFIQDGILRKGILKTYTRK